MPCLTPSRTTRSSGLARMITVLVTGLSLGLLGILGGAVVGGTSHAASQAYLSWAYYQWTDDEWTMANTGAAETTPADGDVEGWRFAAMGEDTPPRLPRADGDFEMICGSTPADEAADGQKRVAVVIDYGVAEEAPGSDEPAQPRGECAVIDEAATGEEVLASVTDLRQDSGLVCGVDGYPAQGCAEAADGELNPDPEPDVDLALPDSDASPETDDPDDGSPQDADDETDPGATESGGADQPVEREGPGPLTVLFVALGALVVLIVLGGVLQVRRNAARRDSASSSGES